LTLKGDLAAKILSFDSTLSALPSKDDEQDEGVQNVYRRARKPMGICRISPPAVTMARRKAAATMPKGFLRPSS